MATGKPLTRSAQLTPFSHDHHEGLLFVWKIREGLRKNVSLQVINDFINWFWKNHLEAHFRAEEQSFVSHFASDDLLIRKMITEHDAVRGLVDSVPGNSYDDIASLATILHDHIRFEERELFPYIEKKLTEKELDEMRGNLEHEISCSSEWHNEFWK